MKNFLPSVKRLALTRETLRTLEPQQLSEVGSGWLFGLSGTCRPPSWSFGERCQTM
jgi:hypothetical protein